MIRPGTERSHSLFFSTPGHGLVLQRELGLEFLVNGQLRVILREHLFVCPSLNLKL
jgi:hypothetical protein